MAKAFFIYTYLYILSENAHQIPTAGIASDLHMHSTTPNNDDDDDEKQKNKLKTFMSKSVINNDTDGKLQFGFLQSVGTWTR